MDLSFFSMPFVWRAIVAGVLIALCAALLGVTLVLRRLSFMGDGLSHVAFGAMAVAGALGLAGVQMAVALPVTAVCAVFLLRCGAKVQGDAALAMLSVGAMAAGYMMMNIYPSSSNVSGDVCSTLFGAVSILTLTNAETILCVALAIGVLLFHLFTYHMNFDVAFDEDFARVSGIRTSLYNFISAIVTAVVIVVSMRLVGALLVSALIVFPAVSAMKAAKSFLAVTLLAAVIAVATAMAGIFAAVVAGTPVGATIVMVDVVTMLFFRSWRLAIGLCALIGAVIWFEAAPAKHPAAADSGRRISVIAAIHPIYDWANNIVGGRTNAISVALLQKGGADLHSYQPSAADIREIDRCDLFIHVGGISDAWAKKLSPRMALALLDALPPRHLHDVHCCCEHHHDADDDGGGERHHHEHEAQDEHIWLSLRDAATCVAIIAERLAALDPAGAEQYRANARAYADALRSLDADYAAAFAVPGRRTLLFADRFPFARLADDYSLECIAAFRGCSADAEASFQTISHLAHELDEHALKAIFVLEQGDRRLAEAVRAASTAKDQDIRVIDSMQSSPSADYIATMRANLRAFTAD